MFSLYKLAMLVVVIVIGAATIWRPGFKRDNTERVIENEVKAMQAGMPRMLNEGMRAERISYADRTVSMYVTALTPLDRSPEKRRAYDRMARDQYCLHAQKIWKAGVSMRYDIYNPPGSMNDRLETMTITLQPQDCGA